MKSTSNKIFFPSVENYEVTAEFADESVSSDGGILLLREIDKKLSLTKSIAASIPDHRDPTRITHSIQSMLQQRIFGLALGYEDINDHNILRKDPAFQTSVDRTEILASSSTLCRLEKTADREMAFSMSKIMVDQFIESFSEKPKKLILDFDPTDIVTHGEQEDSHYNGYYKHDCFLPLYVYCGEHLLVSYLRTSNADSAKHGLAILSILVKYLRQHWSDVEIIFRGDCAFGRDHIMSWCERNNVGYIIGLSKNSRVMRKVKSLLVRAERDYEITGIKQRLFDQVYYAAKSWKHERKVIIKAEHNEKGQNPRLIITNVEDLLPQEIYDNGYCKRGDMENRIKEVKLDCKANRMSCHQWWSNQFRLLFSSFAYILLSQIRRIALSNTKFAKAQCSTIRIKLFKIGAMIIKKAKCIRFILSAHYPDKELFKQIKFAIRSA